MNVDKNLLLASILTKSLIEIQESIELNTQQRRDHIAGRANVENKLEELHIKAWYLKEELKKLEVKQTIEENK